MNLTYSLNYATNHLIVHEAVTYGHCQPFASVLGDPDDPETMTRVGVTLYRLYEQMASAPACPACGSYDYDDPFCADCALEEDETSAIGDWYEHLRGEAVRA